MLLKNAALAVIFVSAWWLTVVIRDLLHGEEAKVRSRLNQVWKRYRFTAVEDNGRRRPSLRQTLVALAEKRMTGKRLAERISRRLRRADLRLQVSEFLFLVAGSSLVMAVLGGLLGKTWGARIVSALVGFYLPFYYVNSCQERRRRALEGQLPDALSLLSNALKSGFSFLQALELVAGELPPPISRELSQVVKETRVNIALEESLQNMVQRTGSQDLDLVVTAVLIQRQVGGNLSEVLDRISATIRERVRIMGEIRTLTAQGRISGIVLAVLPVGLGVVIYFLNPGYMEVALQHPLGRLMLGVAALMQLVGAIIVRRIVNIEI